MSHDVTPRKLLAVGVDGDGVDVRRLAEDLVAAADRQGVALIGEGGLLTELTRQVLQTALQVEMAKHLGYDRGDAPTRGARNVRNGSTHKTVRTEIGDVTIEVPRDRAGTFEPQIVPKRQRRIAGFDEAVISLYAKGMSTGDITAHLSEVYDTEVSRDLVSRVTDEVLTEMRAWQSRPLDRVYPVVLIDVIVMKVRRGSTSAIGAAVVSRPVYVAMGINLDGVREVLGMWVGSSSEEGSKPWMKMLTELRRRGVRDACIVCCDGLNGLPKAVRATWPAAVVQTCVLHLVRSTLHCVSKEDRQSIAKEMRAIYTAATVADAEALFDKFAATWQPQYPTMIEMWRRYWSEFVPFLSFPTEVRKLVYTTNGIESLNANFRAATRRRAHFPDEQSAMKVLYLSVVHRGKSRPYPVGQIKGWESILNVLSLTFGDRLGVDEGDHAVHQASDRPWKTGRRTDRDRALAVAEPVAGHRHDATGAKRRT